MAEQMPVQPADFTDPEFVSTRSPQDVFDVITEGRMESLMPPWGDTLSEEEIWDVTAYVWSLHLEPATIEGGEKAYAAACAECHGPDGAGMSAEAGAPSLQEARWLQLNETQWREAVQAPSHPRIDDAADAVLLSAITYARSFSLGFTQDSPNLEGDGVITVRVLNGTTGEAVAGAPVTLLIFDGAGFLTNREIEADEQGVARFEGLSRDPVWAFLAQALYNDMPFASDVFQFETGEPSLDVLVHVYEPGGSLDDVRIRRAHWFVNLATADSIDVGELHVIENGGDRVYMGEEGENGREVLVFRLPPNAVNVGVEGGEASGRFVITGDAIIDTAPLPPGQRQILFRYTLPVVDGAVDMTHPFEYPIDNLNLLIPDIGLQVEVSEWTEEPPLQTEGGAFLNYIITSLPPGSAPPVKLSGISAQALAQTMSNEAAAAGGQQIIDRNATPGISGQPYTTPLVASLAALVLAVGSVIAIRRHRSQLASEPVRRRQLREALIQAIADLDDAYEAGELAEAEYQAERTLLKAKLIALSQQEASP